MTTSYSRHSRSPDPPHRPLVRLTTRRSPGAQSWKQIEGAKLERFGRSLKEENRFDGIGSRDSGPGDGETDEMIGVSARKGEKKGDRRGRRDLEVTAESADLYMAGGTGWPPEELLGYDV
ncbi:hypothetical protein GW17_00031094 [Ensete ventricosum]|nr:hypothetical protein GW17_00031094 [Ensete ventricosum]